MTFIYFIIALGILIFIHELGHFIIAKRAGICVEVFSLGFGPRIIGIKRGETEYRISALPLGGYVKMLGLGEAPDEESSSNPRSFSKKGVGVRAGVIFFGPAMNLIFALAFMPIVFMIGRQEPVYLKEAPVIIDVRASSPAAIAGIEKGDLIVSVDGKEVGTWEELLNRVILSPGSPLMFEIERSGVVIKREITVGELPEIKGGYVGFEPMFFLGNEAVIDNVQPHGSADKAGLKGGDRVISFGGAVIADWIDLSMKVDANGGSKAPMIVDRAGEKIKLMVTPTYSEEHKRWLIGISKDRRSGVPMTTVRYGFIDSVIRGTEENIKLVGLTLGVLERLLTFKLSYKVLGGPIIIAKTSAAAAASGLSDFIYFLVFLSMQLAILNLLPIPVLDGGHLVFLGIEALRRRPLGVKVRSIADHVGLVLLISIMVLVTYNDIENVWGIREMLKKIF